MALIRERELMAPESELSNLEREGLAGVLAPMIEPVGAALFRALADYLAQDPLIVTFLAAMHLEEAVTDFDGTRLGMVEEALDGVMAELARMYELRWGEAAEIALAERVARVMGERETRDA